MKKKKSTAIKSGEYYKLKKPKFAEIIGQGEAPKGIVYKKGETFLLKYGSIYKASGSVDSERGFGNLDMKPYPLLRTEIIDNLKNQFEFILLTEK